MANPWAVEGILDRLKELYTAGISFGDIANELSGEFNLRITRNAALGKAHRIGLAMREPRKPAKSAGRPVYKPQRQIPFRAPRVKPELFVVQTIEVTDPPRHLSLMELETNDCRFPFGNGSEDYTFCGQRTSEGLPYCAAHARLAYRPIGARLEEEAAA